MRGSYTGSLGWHGFFLLPTGVTILGDEVQPASPRALARPSPTPISWWRAITGARAAEPPRRPLLCRDVDIPADSLWPSKPPGVPDRPAVSAVAKLRRTHGPVGEGRTAIMLSRRRVPWLAIGEGLETMLSVAGTGVYPAWALCSARSLAALPVLPGITAKLGIFADHDPRGLAAADRCRRRWKAAGPRRRNLPAAGAGTGLERPFREAGMNKPAFNFASAVQPPREPELDDFLAYLPPHQYIYMPTGELWPAASVNAACRRSRSAPAARRTCRPAPGSTATGRRADDLGAGRADDDRGPPDRPTAAGSSARAARVLQPLPAADRSAPRPGDADRWLDHVEQRLSGDDADHIISWLAHRVQRPDEKINHALVLGGARASARTRCSSRSSTRSARGTSPRSRRSRCSAASTAS